MNTLIRHIILWLSALAMVYLTIMAATE